MSHFDVLILVKPAKVAMTAFFAILFLQSGLDKVLDWKGNQSYIQSHFSKSVLAGTTSILFPVITLIECAAGVASAIGFMTLLFGADSQWGLYGIELSAVAILMLFFGQRMAKDYAGAATLVPYFIASVLGMVLFTGF